MEYSKQVILAGWTKDKTRFYMRAKGMGDAIANGFGGYEWKTWGKIWELSL